MSKEGWVAVAQKRLYGENTPDATPTCFGEYETEGEGAELCIPSVCSWVEECAKHTTGETAPGEKPKKQPAKIPAAITTVAPMEVKKEPEVKEEVTGKLTSSKPNMQEQKREKPREGSKGRFFWDKLEEAKYNENGIVQLLRAEKGWTIDKCKKEFDTAVTDFEVTYNRKVIDKGKIVTFEDIETFAESLTNTIERGDQIIETAKQKIEEKKSEVKQPEVKQLALDDVNKSKKEDLPVNLSLTKISGTLESICSLGEFIVSHIYYEDGIPVEITIRRKGYKPTDCFS